MRASVASDTGDRKSIVVSAPAMEGGGGAGAVSVAGDAPADSDMHPLLSLLLRLRRVVKHAVYAVALDDHLNDLVSLHVGVGGMSCVTNHVSHY